MKTAQHSSHRMRTAVVAALALAVLFVAIESSSYTSAVDAVLADKEAELLEV